MGNVSSLNKRVVGINLSWVECFSKINKRLGVAINFDSPQKMTPQSLYGNKK